MNVADIMTRDVITVSATTSIPAAARLMVDHGVSGLPVVDQRGAIVGIITEGDLIVRQKTPPLTRRSRWALFFADPEGLARDYQRAAGTTVGEVMTREVAWVGPEWPIASVASKLEWLRIRRLPVVDASGQLVGIVSRGDLIKALAVTPVAIAGRRPDTDLAADMRARLARESWASSGISVEAVDGVLRLSGMVESRAERSAIETMARAVDGCLGVEGQLILRPPHPAYV
jgi:CBS domain-containing protein